MTGHPPGEWHESAGIIRALYPSLFLSPGEVTPLTPQAHVIRHAFELLELDGVFCTEGAPIVFFGGDPTAWLDLIDSQVPDILRLILSTWDEMPPLPPNALEDPTTEPLCRALRKNRTTASLPFRIDIQMVELDPAAGQDQGRMDIAFSPMVPHEAFYFCLECKRLNVTIQGRRRTLGTEYVTQGMRRFVERQYGDQVRHGGMLGYVLDSRVDLAITAVQNAIQARSKDLKIVGESGLRQSSFLPEMEFVFQTAHVRDELAPQFLLQHIFAGAT